MKIKRLSDNNVPDQEVILSLISEHCFKRLLIQDIHRYNYSFFLEKSTKPEMFKYIENFLNKIS